jgi:hypothetical protein
MASAAYAAWEERPTRIPQGCSSCLGAAARQFAGDGPDSGDRS